MVAKYWFEQFARVPVDIDVASEFRYRDPVLEDGGLALFIFAKRGDGGHAQPRCAIARRTGRPIAVVVNVPTSTMAREADLLLPTHAGPETGCASTKAFHGASWRVRGGTERAPLSASRKRADSPATEEAEMFATCSKRLPRLKCCARP